MLPRGNMGHIQLIQSSLFTSLLLVVIYKSQYYSINVNQEILIWIKLKINKVLQLAQPEYLFDNINLVWQYSGDLNNEHLDKGNIWITNFHLFAISYGEFGDMYEYWMVTWLADKKSGNWMVIRHLWIIVPFS